MSAETPAASGSIGDIAIAIGKALQSFVEAYRQPLAEVEAARKQVAEQAGGDLAAVDGRT